MLTLSLLRHAKSAWDDPDLDDHERALAPRGIKAAPLIGKYIAQEKLKPDLILCSGAVRARATLALVLPTLPAPPPEIRTDDELYLASPATLFETIRSLAPGPKHVMLIGHNPGMHALALELTGGGDRKDLAELAARFPTAALAVFTFRETSWRAVKPGSGRLEHFVTPRGLRE